MKQKFLCNEKLSSTYNMFPCKCVKFCHADKKYQNIQLYLFQNRNTLQIKDIEPLSMN